MVVEGVWFGEDGEGALGLSGFVVEDGGELGGGLESVSFFVEEPIWHGEG